MATNFRIQRRRKNNDLHLNLIGNFDGSSAMELLEELQRHVGKTWNVHLHTSSVSSMTPFGKEVFNKRFRFHSKSLGNFVISGKYKNLMDFEICS